MLSISDYFKWTHFLMEIWQIGFCYNYIWRRVFVHSQWWHQLWFASNSRAVPSTQHTGITVDSRFRYPAVVSRGHPYGRHIEWGRAQRPVRLHCVWHIWHREGSPTGPVYILVIIYINKSLGKRSGIFLLNNFFKRLTYIIAVEGFRGISEYNEHITTLIITIRNNLIHGIGTLRCSPCCWKPYWRSALRNIYN